MENFNNQSHCIQLFLALAVSVLFTGCSDENNNKTSTTTSSGYGVSRPKTENRPDKKKTVSKKTTQTHGKEHYEDMSKPLDKASKGEKSKFKKEFTEDCLARETMNSEDKEYDRKRWQKPCECIAKDMTEHLTDEEAEEFLKDDNHTRSLQIRFEAAAYKCLQAAKQPKAPQIFKH